MAECYVLLKCVKEGSKLRVKMMSSAPFVKGANCQFPRAVREEGTYYVVRAEKVKFKGNFYTAMQNDTIVCQTTDEAEVRRYIGNLDGKIKIKTIFGDDEEVECAICMSAAKDSVFAPCGHYACCGPCAAQCKSCPICRGAIGSILKRAEVE
jgi:Zinc finger, C3HC4 type (RING finger)